MWWETISVVSFFWAVISVGLMVTGVACSVDDRRRKKIKEKRALDRDRKIELGHWNRRYKKERAR